MKNVFFYSILILLTFISCGKNEKGTTSTSSSAEEETGVVIKDTLFYLYETTAQSSDQQEVNLNVIYRFIVKGAAEETIEEKTIEDLNTTEIKPAVTEYLRKLIKKYPKADLRTLKDQIELSKINKNLSNKHPVEIISLKPTVKFKELIIK
ncbi:hypothetical protein [Aquimarina spongiae]|uniref:Lipoprotein n=1 Tax=Aquimarina spongiae TaxID=570521 RepID=A0A1M6E4J8_9FLAO|nr:hypothetical protein [Aquimarina spongiae]SHI80422.1 hypothetical protein SAMN04488508_103212 [Aquimarina spongiae]